MQVNAAWQLIECCDATFTQFVADNVDHNFSTLGGRDTLHAMGMMAVSLFAPCRESLSTRTIRRIQQRLRIAEVCCNIDEHE